MRFSCRETNGGFYNNQVILNKMRVVLFASAMLMAAGQALSLTKPVFSQLEDSTEPAFLA